MKESDSIEYPPVAFEVYDDGIYDNTPYINVVSIGWKSGDKGFCVVYNKYVVEEDHLLFDPELVTNLLYPTNDELSYLDLIYGSDTVYTYKYMIKYVLEYYNKGKHG